MKKPSKEFRIDWADNAVSNKQPPQPAGPLREYRIKFEKVPGGKKAVPDPDKPGVRSKLGGEPDWVQQPEVPKCSDCKQRFATLVECNVHRMAEIREKFNSRRGSSGRIEQTLRRMLGIDLKMKQYAEGSRFVREVVDKAGMATFNKVWTSPETLPTREEFANPQLWLDRVANHS